MYAPRPGGPLVLCLGLVVAGLVIAAIGGLSGGSTTGGLVACAGAVPAGYAAWQGLQQRTQASLALSLLGLVVALGVGGLLILLRVVDWFR